jgi:hypothetical protein
VFGCNQVVRFYDFNFTPFYRLQGGPNIASWSVTCGTDDGTTAATLWQDASGLTETDSYHNDP